MNVTIKQGDGLLSPGSPYPPVTMVFWQRARNRYCSILSLVEGYIIICYFQRTIWKSISKAFRMQNPEINLKEIMNTKIIPVETIPGIRGGRIKENGRGDKFKYDIFDTL
jgi:hypothetical protein